MMSNQQKRSGGSLAQTLLFSSSSLDGFCRVARNGARKIAGPGPVPDLLGMDGSLKGPGPVPGLRAMGITLNGPGPTPTVGPGPTDV